MKLFKKSRTLARLDNVSDHSADETSQKPSKVKGTRQSRLSNSSSEVRGSIRPDSRSLQLEGRFKTYGTNEQINSSGPSFGKEPHEMSREEIQTAQLSGTNRDLLFSTIRSKKLLSSGAQQSGPQPSSALGGSAVFAMSQARKPYQ